MESEITLQMRKSQIRYLVVKKGIQTLKENIQIMDLFETSVILKSAI